VSGAGAQNLALALNCPTLVSFSTAQIRATWTTTVIDSETLLRRKEAAEALSQAGFPISPDTLATMNTRGGGPLVEYWGRIPLYRWGTTLEWARSRLSRPFANTSEAMAAKSMRFVHIGAKTEAEIDRLAAEGTP
jgi:hypothetical protein